MSVFYRVIDEQLLIFGHTYPHKETIKSLGAKFNAAQKAWSLPNTDNNRHLLDKVCQSLGGGALASMETSVPTRETEWEAPAVIPGPKTYLISQLMAEVQVVITSGFPKAVWVVGEVQNVSVKQSGIFFQLSEPKDEVRSGSALSVKATLWHSSILNLRKEIQSLEIGNLLTEGMKVRVLCQVNFFKERGQISLNVIDFDSKFTLGALALAREALLKELRSLGLDKANKSLTMPAFPFRVGLISADNSRAKSDFLDQLKSQNFCGEVIFAAASMQGERTVGEVCQALTILQAQLCDVIVLTRGGGSAADLHWFNNRDLAMALAHCKVPVVSAIGHHEDVSVAEEISYMQQKTPTAAADYIVEIFRDTAAYLSQLCFSLCNAATRFLREGELREDRLQRSLMKSVEDNLQMKLLVLLGLDKALSNLDPRPWLKQGWTQLTTQDHKRIKSIHEVSIGGQLHARLLDGTLSLKVTEKESNHE